MSQQMQTMSSANVKDYDIESLREGMSYHYTTQVTTKDVESYADICGDCSPLHVDRQFGAKSSFGGNVVHGMLVASHFSTLVGVFLPGKNCLLTGMEVEFVRPIPVGSEITVSASIVSIQRVHRMILVKLLAYLDGMVCVQGQARVKVTAQA